MSEFPELGHDAGLGEGFLVDDSAKDDGSGSTKFSSGQQEWGRTSSLGDARRRDFDVLHSKFFYKHRRRSIGKSRGIRMVQEIDDLLQIVTSLFQRKVVKKLTQRWGPAQCMLRKRSSSGCSRAVTLRNFMP